MSNFNDLKSLVIKKGYGSSQYKNINGESVYLSRGIREVVFADEETEQKLMELIFRFQKGEFGTAEEFGKSERPGHEYGRYDDVITFEENDEDTAVWVHRTEDAIKVYFKFER